VEKGEPANEGGQGGAPGAAGQSADGGQQGAANQSAEGGGREKNLQEAREMLGLLGTTTKALQEAWAKPPPQ
jgi:hypothetical protein